MYFTIWKWQTITSHSQVNVVNTHDSKYGSQNINIKVVALSCIAMCKIGASVWIEIQNMKIGYFKSGFLAVNNHFVWVYQDYQHKYLQFCHPVINPTKECFQVYRHSLSWTVSRFESPHEFLVCSATLVDGISNEKPYCLSAVEVSVGRDGPMKEANHKLFVNVLDWLSAPQLNLCQSTNSGSKHLPNVRVFTGSF